MEDHRNDSRILGDINPTPTIARSVRRDQRRCMTSRTGHADESMEGGSRHDESEHSGSRDVTEGVTGGTGTETGGTRNYRTGRARPAATSATDRSRRQRVASPLPAQLLAGPRRCRLSGAFGAVTEAR
jgi:hypothetical protein